MANNNGHPSGNDAPHGTDGAGGRQTTTAATIATDPTDAHAAAYALPPIGNDPGTGAATTPGSFAKQPDIGGPDTFASPDTPGMPGVSDKTAWDFLPDDWSLEVIDTNAPIPQDEDAQTTMPGDSCSPGCPCGETYAAYVFTDTNGIRRRVAPPIGFKPVTQLEHARLGIITPQMQRVAEREGHLSPAQVRDEVAAGRMVIPANKKHLDYQLDAMSIGRAGHTKVNANMGASPVSSDTNEEVEKLRWAERWGADTVMDLSTGGDLDATRETIIQHAKVPIGTVPIYSMIIGRKLEDLDEAVIRETVEHQAKQGVDYFTVHAGVLYEHLHLARDRQIGLVSRGGSLLAKWMLTTGQENPTNTAWEDICRIMREHDVTFSIGDGCRPGGLADATDDIQLAELVEIGNLTERAWKQGVQVMVEGPGHVPFDQIEYNMKLQRKLCHGAPFYVLGPLTTDVFPGYDHITSAIGATSAGYHGASMLCYVTPKEHLGLPKREDVKQGCIAYKIAAHAADVALGIPGSRDWDDELTKARAALNWDEHIRLSFDPDTARAYHDEDLDVDTDFCAMCGHDWCSVRISKDIQAWASGKDQQYQWDKPKRSKALSQAQQRILEQRGYLKPEEIHKLAEKTKKRMGGDQGKADCHSDYVDPDTAQAQQQARGAPSPEANDA
jgi:phosphomethylpyrimidine synthase